jgi:hypothetical protein
MAVHCFGSPRPARDGVTFRQARLTVTLQAGGNGPASPAPGSAAATATGQ